MLMNKNYLITGGIVLLIVIAVFFFRSTDSTISPNEENALTPASSFSHSHGIAVDANDPNKLYIATHEGLYLLEEDTDLYRIGRSRDDLMGFSSHPTDSNTFFSSGHPVRGGNIGFQKTTDGGVTWERVSTGLGGPVDFHSMTVSAVNPNIIYGFFNGKLQRSIDGGKSWEYASGVISPLSLSTDYAEENTVYAATRDGVQVSKNQGDDWSSLSTELDGAAVSVFVKSPQDDGYALVFSERLSGLGKSSDDGISWTKVSEDFGGETIFYLAFAKSDSNIVYALTDKNSVYKSDNKGETWNKIR